MSNNLLISTYNGVRKIQLNRPQVRNAINLEMYQKLGAILNEDASNSSIRATIITGVGDFFSSGNDFSSTSFNNFDGNIVSEDFEHFGEIAINYPKLFIAVVNGPAIGIAVTLLGLCDIVYASDRATFQVPFVRIGICPDGCASYTFPRILGTSKSMEMSLLGTTMTAQEALQRGFVAKVIPHDTLNEFVESLQKIGELPLDTLVRVKNMLMAPIRDKLSKANMLEFQKLRSIVMSDEFLESIMALFNKRSKL